MTDTRLFKEHFYKSFVKISTLTWQEMPFFQFPQYKSMENLSCHSNETKEPIFIKKITFQSPSPRMLQTKFGSNRSSGFRGDVRKCCHQTTDDDDGQLHVPIV